MAEFFKFGDLNSAMLNLKGDLFFSLKNRSTVSIWVLFFFLRHVLLPALPSN